MTKTHHDLMKEPTDENIQTIMEKYHITTNGFIYKDGPVERFRPNNETIRFIYDNFDFLFEEKTKFNVGSYGAKHYVENFRRFMSQGDGYVSNGELIIALILCGVAFKYDDGPNCVFKCSYRNEIRYFIDKGYKLQNRLFANKYFGRFCLQCPVHQVYISVFQHFFLSSFLLVE